MLSRLFAGLVMITTVPGVNCIGRCRLLQMLSLSHPLTGVAAAHPPIEPSGLYYRHHSSYCPLPLPGASSREILLVVQCDAVLSERLTSLWVI